MRTMSLAGVWKHQSDAVSDVVEKNSNSYVRRRSWIPCVVVEKITTRRREGVGIVVEKNEEIQQKFVIYLQQ